MLPVNVWAFVPVKVTVPEEAAVGLNDQSPVKEIFLDELEAVQIPVPPTSPLTVSTLLLAILNVPLMVIPAQVLFPFVETVLPLAIITISVVNGTTPPGHGALLTLEFQLPLPVLVIVAPFTVPITTIIDANTIRKTLNFLERSNFRIIGKELTGPYLYRKRNSKKCLQDKKFQMKNKVLGDQEMP
jgi:hypothetical protein